MDNIIKKVNTISEHTNEQHKGDSYNGIDCQHDIRSFGNGGRKVKRFDNDDCYEVEEDAVRNEDGHRVERRSDEEEGLVARHVESDGALHCVSEAQVAQRTDAQIEHCRYGYTYVQDAPSS